MPQPVDKYSWEGRRIMYTSLLSITLSAEMKVVLAERCLFLLRERKGCITL
jgi:hypothetical protein